MFFFLFFFHLHEIKIVQRKNVEYKKVCKKKKKKKKNDGKPPPSCSKFFITESTIKNKRIIQNHESDMENAADIEN